MTGAKYMPACSAAWLTGHRPCRHCAPFCRFLSVPPTPTHACHVLPSLQAYLGSGAPTDSLAHLSRFTALRSLDLPAAAYPTDGCQLAMFSQLEELTLREGVSPRLLRCVGGHLRRCVCVYCIFQPPKQVQT